MSTATVRQIRPPQDRSDTQARIRKAVKGLLGINGYHQKDLAGPLAMSVNNVNHKLAGRSKFTLEEVEALADFFGVDIMDLLDPDRWTPRGPESNWRARRDSNPQPSDP